MKTTVASLIVIIAAAWALRATAQTPPTKNVAASSVHFSHADHAKKQVAIADCRSCHTLTSDFSVLPPTQAAPHFPCANAACHEAEFFSKKPTICGVCHDSAEPWTKPVARINQQRRSEFAGEINHATHAKADHVGVAEASANAVCQHCHGNVLESQGSARVQTGHPICGTCHGKSAQPAMTDCGQCHRMGQAKAAFSPVVSQWSVAALFSHATHASDPRKKSQAPACIECHQSVTQAQTLRQIKAPTMQSCDGCHNGTHAFKTTGFECARCHGTKALGAP